MKKETSEQRWDTLKSKRRSPGTSLSGEMVQGTVVSHARAKTLQGRKSRQVGRVSEENNSPMSRSVEDAPSDHTQFPIELLATQDHKSERIGQV